MKKFSKNMCKISSHIVRWCIGGVLYGFLEIVWRGYTHWSMVLLAVLICIPLDIANDIIPWELSLQKQSLIGGLVITAAEFVAGCILNLWLGLGVWDYSNQFGNILGQICPLYTFLWCILACPVIVIFDWLDYKLCKGTLPSYDLFGWTLWVR